MNDEHLMEFAREITGERASLTWHEGIPPHCAVRITGCDANAACEVGREIERGLSSGGNPPAEFGFVYQAGFAAVWIR